MREIISRQPLIQIEGEILNVKKLYVRTVSPLPAIGESIEAIFKPSGKRFSGQVISVDLIEHTYDAVIDLSEEAGA